MTPRPTPDELRRVADWIESRAPDSSIESPWVLEVAAEWVRRQADAVSGSTAWCQAEEKRSRLGCECPRGHSGEHRNRAVHPWLAEWVDA